MSWHAALPWDWARRTYLSFRGRFFSKEPPEGPFLRVDAAPAELERLLGERGFAPQWGLSYDKGEDVNLAFQFYDDRRITAPRADLSRLLHRLTGGRLGSVTEEPVEWWQDHVRGWDRGDRLYLLAHQEPSARHEDSAHIAGVGFHAGKGLAALQFHLEEAGVSYGRVTGPLPVPVEETW